jgi:hypothetical protein
MVIDWLMQVLLSTGASTMILVCLAFLLRNLILERLKGAIGHEYDKKLENLRLEHNRVLESLREARTEREAFRALAFSSLTSIQSATLERRIKAIEALWQSIRGIRSHIPPYIYAMDAAEYDKANFGPKLHPLLKDVKLAEALKPGLEEAKEVIQARPFLGDRLFALFRAAQTVIGYAISITISSYQDGTLRPWYEEPPITNLLHEVLSTEELATF